jgi:hypothetical protein
MSPWLVHGWEDEIDVIGLFDGLSDCFCSNFVSILDLVRRLLFEVRCKAS